MDRSQVETALRAFFQARGAALACAYLFGSVARGSAARGSDVDVDVLPLAHRKGTLDALPPDLEGDLERLLEASVDVVDLHSAPPGPDPPRASRTTGEQENPRGGWRLRGGRGPDSR